MPVDAALANTKGTGNIDDGRFGRPAAEEVLLRCGREYIRECVFRRSLVLLSAPFTIEESHQRRGVAFARGCAFRDGLFDLGQVIG